MGELQTTGDIAESLGVPHHRILYIIQTRKIEPATRVKHYRLFDQNAVETIEAELAQIADERPVIAGVM